MLMQFDYRRIDTLPRLAWCAQLTQGRPVIRVQHGPWVETRDACFFEGAWNGAFGQSDFASADTFNGSGGKLTEHGALFAGPTHCVERIYAARAGNELFVSNSWVFLLVALDDGPDPAYSDYFFDLQHNYRQFHPTPVALRTQKGHAVQLLDKRNLLVAPDLTMRYTEKRLGRAPGAYAEVVAHLQTTVDQIVENATDPARQQCYTPVTMISRGYDSPAVSLLAARAGCREAITFAKSQPDEPNTLDDGAPIAAVLGLGITAFARYDYRAREDFPEAEFCTIGPFNWAPVAAMEERLVGALLFAGTVGYNWESDGYELSPYDVRMMGTPIFASSSITEFRLRVGFVLFPALHSAAQHVAALRRISHAPEMRPWVLPNTSYNKPILRRILEEAGVPRALFGQSKLAGAYANLARAEAFSPASREDFARFCVRNRLHLTRRQAFSARFIVWVVRHLTRWGVRLLRLLPPDIYFALMPYTWWLYPKRRQALWRSPALYTFHWGYARTQQRYKVG